MGKGKRKLAAAAVIFLAVAAVIWGTAREYAYEGVEADIVLCLDDSGSMHSKQKARNEAAAEFLESLGGKVNFGVLFFQYNVTSASEILRFNTVGARDAMEEDLLGQIHSEEGGNTNFGAALEYALTMLREFRASSGKVPAVIILFTDGENDFLDGDGNRIGEYVREANAQTEAAMDLAREEGVAIHTVCLNKKDIQLLQRVSEETGGNYTRIESMEELPDALLGAAAPYQKTKLPGGDIGMVILILLVVVGTGIVAAYYYQNFKKQEYLMDYQVYMMREELDQRSKREELDAQIRQEQKNKSFYVDVIVTHGNAIGGRSCFDNEGRRRGGILSIGDVVMMGRNARGEDCTYRIDEAGLELWATFDENELILRSKKNPFEIRKEGCARDQGDRTQKATIKCGQQYYIILGSKHEIGLKTVRG